MQNVSYYRVLTDVDNNFLSEEVPIQVNCTGYSRYSGEVWGRTVRRDYYLFYLWGGGVRVDKPAEGQVMRPGDMIVFGPDRPFDYIKQPNRDMEYYWVHFTGYHAGRMLKECGIPVNQIVSPGIHLELCEGFRSLFSAFLTRDSLFEIETAQRLCAILVQLGRALSGHSEDAAPTDPRIRQALGVIHENVGRPLSVEQLAEESHMSVSHFRSVFRRITGFSPQEYITLSKLNYACLLLRQTDLSIREVGEASGYADPQYFSRIFGRHFGLSPGFYRNVKRQEPEKCGNLV